MAKKEMSPIELAVPAVDRDIAVIDAAKQLGSNISLGMAEQAGPIAARSIASSKLDWSGAWTS